MSAPPSPPRDCRIVRTACVVSTKLRSVRRRRGTVAGEASSPSSESQTLQAACSAGNSSANSPSSCATLRKLLALYARVAWGLRVVASLRKYLRFERFEIALALALLAARDARATFDDATAAAGGAGEEDAGADTGELFVGVAPDDEVCRVEHRAPITVRVRSTLMWAECRGACAFVYHLSDTPLIHPDGVLASSSVGFRIASERLLGASGLRFIGGKYNKGCKLQCVRTNIEVPMATEDNILVVETKGKASEIIDSPGFRLVVDEVRKGERSPLVDLTPLGAEDVTSKVSLALHKGESLQLDLAAQAALREWRDLKTTARGALEAGVASYQRQADASELNAAAVEVASAMSGGQGEDAAVASAIAPASLLTRWYSMSARYSSLTRLIHSAGKDSAMHGSPVDFSRRRGVSKGCSHPHHREGMPLTRALAAFGR